MQKWGFSTCNFGYFYLTTNNINEKADKNYYEDKYWTCNTVSDWQEQFPFWSYDTVKRTLKSLRNMNLLITGNFNKIDYDRTLWYTINYSEVTKLDEKLEKIIQNKKMQKLEKKAKNHPQTIDNSQWGKMPQWKSAKCPNLYQRLIQILIQRLSIYQSRKKK